MIRPNYLNNKKNLLAYSGGVDSTALFFLLLNAKIDFDIAIVDYQVRPESKEEVEYAKTLANEYNKKIYIHTSTSIKTNFESNARAIRYKFFEKLINEHKYENLITAHQLNDRVEWFMMQFAKGSGLVELIGFDEIEAKQNYKLVRPLLNTSRSDIEKYLSTNKIKYFQDASNSDPKYKRNEIRTLFNQFTEDNINGIKKSFEYLNVDKSSFFDLKYKEITKELFLISRNKDDNINIRYIDKVLKILGILISKSQRDEIINTKDCVISNTVAVCFTDTYIWIGNYITGVIMQKDKKEEYRRLCIPPKIRPYLYKNSIDIKEYI
ncbi:MAG: tRNA(Ile)-lysidine synthetase (EC [uncultured Campylobacterales bacterium]|uniref:tRNA(Ile)-lysidine synthase n=1 Tax=uncultured Campylobacterales bacterium TaxID=352960 RepID=A0A6S6SHX7_9BACT|nr:MAG: tRNA(Ile)-lysidine synthetase (EC [uncultured Campylobacterales bacterium]